MVKSFFSQKVDATGLAVFRILYSLVLLFELKHLYHFRQIMFSKIPFEVLGEIGVESLLSFWFLAVILLFFGLFGRIASIINYIFSIVIFSAASSFEYHIYYTYVGIAFLLMFMPTTRVLSIDNLLQKLKYSSLSTLYHPEKSVLLLNYLVPVFAGIGLFYFDSDMFKFTSELWLNGLGVWLPASLPMATWTDTSWLMNQKEIVIFLGYFVMIFEFVFIGLMWFKKFRVPLLIIGVIFHVGIWIEFPIPIFAAAFIAIYTLLIPCKWWHYLGNLTKNKKSRYKFYYDKECPLCLNVVIFIRHFDVFGYVDCLPVQDNFKSESAFAEKTIDEVLTDIYGVDSKGKIYKGYSTYSQLMIKLRYPFMLGLFMLIPGVSSLGKMIYAKVARNRITERCTAESCGIPEQIMFPSEERSYFFKGWNKLNFSKVVWALILLFFIAGQSIVSYFSAFPQKMVHAVNLNHTKVNTLAAIMYGGAAGPLKKYLGICHHGLFLDDHFKNYTTIVSITYVDPSGSTSLVPIIDKNGKPAEYIRGSTWANFTFRVWGPNVNVSTFEKGISPYLKFYLQENFSLGEEGKFIFDVKKVTIPSEWESNFLKSQMSQPWTKVGEMYFKEGVPIFEWNNDMYKLL
jgi:predicted DCC family thiol-disulfide oxidoreductase YuxK